MGYYVAIDPAKVSFDTTQRIAQESSRGSVPAVTSGHRYYSAGLGTWIARDPIDIAGGANLYAFVLNQPTDLIDELGKEWSKPDRKGKQRAEIKCECGDSVADLEASGGIAFDFAEYGKWLKPEDGKPPLSPKDKKATEDRVFSIPNTVYVGWGKRSALEVFIFWPAYPFVALQRTAWSSAGHKVVYDDDVNFGEMASYLGDENVHGVAYWGHGPSFTLSPLGAPAPFGGYGFMEPHEGRAGVHHGLWFLLHHGCDSAVYYTGGKSWSDLVAKKGTFGGHTGAVTPYRMLTGMSFFTGTYTP
jgi:RHS repeat-associated protein